MRKEIIITIIALLILAACNTNTEVNQTEQTQQNTTETPVNTTQIEVQNVEVVATKTFTAGDLVSFPKLSATDPDGDKITYTFSTPLNEKGEWQTKDGDEGEYTATITASDGVNEVSKSVKLVIKYKNRPPAINFLDEITVKEGDTITLTPEVTDPDGDKVDTKITGWMKDFSYKTTFEDQGEHNVAISAKDQNFTTTKEVKVVVENVNRAPQLLELATITVKERETVAVKPKGEDPDKDTLIYKFEAPLNDEGKWETKKGEAGEYTLRVTATDGEFEDSKTVKIIVQPVNDPPVILLESEVIRVKEGETAKIDPKVSDPENDNLVVKISGWMDSKEKTASYEDAGKHTVTITASDAKNTATKELIIEVINVNRPPVFLENSFE